MAQAIACFRTIVHCIAGSRPEVMCLAEGPYTVLHGTGGDVVLDMPDERAGGAEPLHPQKHVTQPTGVAETAFAEDPEAEEAAAALQNDPFLTTSPGSKSKTLSEVECTASDESQCSFCTIAATMHTGRCGAPHIVTLLVANVADDAAKL